MVLALQGNTHIFAGLMSSLGINPLLRLLYGSVKQKADLRNLLLTSLLPNPSPRENLKRTLFFTKVNSKYPARETVKRHRNKTQRSMLPLPLDSLCLLSVCEQFGTATVGEVMHGVPSDVPTSGLSHCSKENRSLQ